MPPRKKEPIHISPVMVTSTSQAAQGILEAIFKLNTGRILDSLKPVIKTYIGKNEGVAANVSTAKVSDVWKYIEDEINLDWQFIIDALKAGVGDGAGSTYASLAENLMGTSNLLTIYHGLLHDVGIAPFVERYFMEKYRPSIPDEDTLITMTRYKRIAPDKYLEYMSYHGYPSELSDHLAAAAQRPIDVSRATEVFWRAKIDVDAYKQILKENMIRDEHLDHYVELTDLIPPGPDLIQMVVREAFDPAQVVVAPPTFAEFMSKKGFKKEWSDRYWTAHFFRAAIGRIEERYRRGDLELSSLRAWYTLADIHPGDHDHLIGTIYDAPTRLDMRSGYASGVYTHADLVRFNRMRHLSPGDAETAARAIELYLLRDEVTKMASAAETDFVDDIMDESELRANLAALRFSPEEVDYRVSLAIWKKEMALRRVPKTTSKNLLSDEIIRMASAAEQDLVDDVIDESTFRADLKALQFTDAEIDYRASLAIHKRDTDLRRSAITVAKTQYQYDKITEQQLRQQLIDLHVAADRVELIITELSSKKKQTVTETKIEKRKRLTEAKIATARDLGLIGDDEYVRRLISIDYTDEDASLMLQIERTPRPISAEELDRRRRSIEARSNRARRRFDLQLAKIDSEILATTRERDDVETIAKESLDVLNLQITTLEREIVEFSTDDLISRAFARPLTRAEILRMNYTDVARRIYDEALGKPEYATLITTSIRDRLNNWKILRERREFAVASYDKRLRDLVQRKKDLEDLRDVIISQRNEELSEYEGELKLVVGG